MTTSFTTRLRSWLLIAGLSGLLIAIGAVIGRSALYLFVAFVVVLNVAMYWFSDKIALKDVEGAARLEGGAGVLRGRA